MGRRVKRITRTEHKCCEKAYEFNSAEMTTWIFYFRKCFHDQLITLTPSLEKARPERVSAKTGLINRALIFMSKYYSARDTLMFSIG